MNVHKTTEIRALTATELVDVSGGNPIAGWAVLFVGAAAWQAVGQAGLWDSVIQWKDGKPGLVGSPQ